MTAAPWLNIRSAQLSAAIDPLGAQLSRLQDAAGNELLWHGDASIWAGRAPLLFPIVGALQDGHYRLGLQRYALSRHGFARGRAFEVLSADDSQVTLRLQASPETLALYPFAFELVVEYALEAATLSVTAWLHNCGGELMPASFGYHPGFRWPLPYGELRAEHCIEFELEEPGRVRRIDAAGLLRPEHFDSPVVQRRLALDDALFRDDVLIFDQVMSRTVTYGARQGPRLRIHYPDAPFLGLWTRPGAPFICIEPWHGITDPAGFSGDFREKPGVFSLTPGDRAAMEMEVTLLPA
ncbi:MAG: aldose 1-epimerase family protein [Steroidobacteraceae bacterium]